MKRWLIPVVIVALMIVGATAGAFASGGDGPATESLPPVSSDDASTQAGCELGASECDDTPDTCEPVPPRSDCGIDPDVCNQVHNITACDGPLFSDTDDAAVQDAGTYQVVVSYNTSVTQPDLDDTDEFLGSFDADLEFLVQESWPPTGVANLQTDTPNFCDAIFDELASRSYIENFSCGPQETLDGAIEDVPVVNPAP